jgi:hypothetical protein
MSLLSLANDLLKNWDDTYSIKKFPPALKFFGKIDKTKNRHILKEQIHLLPKIQRLVKTIEEEISNITVESVSLIKKSNQDD